MLDKVRDYRLTVVARLGFLGKARYTWAEILSVMQEEDIVKGLEDISAVERRQVVTEIWFRFGVEGFPSAEAIENIMERLKQ